MDSHQPSPNRRGFRLARTLEAESQRHGEDSEEREYFEDLADRIAEAAQITAAPGPKLPQPAQNERESSSAPPVRRTRSGRKSRAKAVAIDPDYVPPEFRLIDVSTRLEWKYCKLMFEIIRLSNGRDGSVRGGCFKRVVTFADEYGCNVATLRRHIADLVDHGWIRTAGNGKGRLLIPLKTMEEMCQIVPSFARYVRWRMRGLGQRIPIPHEHKEHNNKPEPGAKRGKSAEPKPLSEADELVVVQAAKADMPRERAEALVRELIDRHGRAPTAEAVAVVEWRYRVKKDVQESGALIRVWAAKLQAGAWNLPAGLERERSKAERDIERERSRAQRVVSNVVSNVISPASTPNTASPTRQPETPAKAAQEAQEAALDRIRDSDPKRWAELWERGEALLAPALRGRTKLPGYRIWVRQEIAGLLNSGDGGTA